MIEWLRNLLSPRLGAPPEIQQARTLIAAIDAGGVPLNPARVNKIARDMGLEVSVKAPVEETIQRIRTLLGNRS